MTKYAGYDGINYTQLRHDIPHVVRAFDNIHDLSIFPLPEQKVESQNKRRMGLGLTGVANAIEMQGYPYGSAEYLLESQYLHGYFRTEVYRASIELAKEKGPFPLFDKEQYLKGAFIQQLPLPLQKGIAEHGIRNSHLISYAPTGTISMCADNVSGSIEPVFAHSYERRMLTEGMVETTELVEDYGVKFFGVKGKKASELTPMEHLKVQAVAQKFCDSAVSKTVNVDKNCSWDDFKNIYLEAWRMGLKGVTTFNADGKRYALLTDNDKESDEDNKAKACFINPDSGQQECS